MAWETADKIDYPLPPHCLWSNAPLGTLARCNCEPQIISVLGGTRTQDLLNTRELHCAWGNLRYSIQNVFTEIYDNVAKYGIVFTEIYDNVAKYGIVFTEIYDNVAKYGIQHTIRSFLLNIWTYIYSTDILTYLYIPAGDVNFVSVYRYDLGWHLISAYRYDLGWHQFYKRLSLRSRMTWIL